MFKNKKESEEVGGPLDIKKKMAKAFNEWQRRYIENPEGFSSDWADVKKTMQEIQNGKEPSYGIICSEYLFKIMGEICKPYD